MSWRCKFGFHDFQQRSNEEIKAMAEAAVDKAKDLPRKERDKIIMQGFNEACTQICSRCGKESLYERI